MDVLFGVIDFLSLGTYAGDNRNTVIISVIFYGQPYLAWREFFLWASQMDAAHTDAGPTSSSPCKGGGRRRGKKGAEEDNEEEKRRSGIGVEKRGERGEEEA